jgi:kynurenine formamidase
MVPWDAQDRRGALNHLGPAEMLAGVAEARLGRAVSLASPIESHRARDDPDPAKHEMTGTPATGPGHGLAFATDRIEMNIHGNANSHLDALCHVAFDGRLYNGVPADSVTESGAEELSVGMAANGIVGRGVLIDVPRARGVPWLEPGDHVTVEDVLVAEREQDVRIGRGDIALIRVGHRRRRSEHGAWDVAAERAGLHPEVVPLLAQRQVAALGGDGNNDSAPSLVDGVDFPVHVLAINALGVMLMDYLQLEGIARACQEAGRWSFLCVIAPLRLPTGTGSPVNPIAVL